MNWPIEDAYRVLYETRDKLGEAIDALPEGEVKQRLLQWFMDTDQMPEIVRAYALKEQDAL